LEAIESGDIAAAKQEIDRQLDAACKKLIAKWKFYDAQRDAGAE
jgi:hypothetical protein